MCPLCPRNQGFSCNRLSPPPYSTDSQQHAANNGHHDHAYVPSPPQYRGSIYEGRLLIVGWEKIKKSNFHGSGAIDLLCAGYVAEAHSHPERFKCPPLSSCRESYAFRFLIAKGVKL